MKYFYLIVDSKDQLCLTANSRAKAREYKKICQVGPLPNDVPPFRIIQLDVSQGKVVR